MLPIIAAGGWKLQDTASNGRFAVVYRVISARPLPRSTLSPKPAKIVSPPSPPLRVSTSVLRSSSGAFQGLR